MALVKRRDGKAGDAARDNASAGRSLNELLSALGAADAVSRRQAARELAAHPNAAPAMCGRLEGERDASVRSVIFTSLIKLKTRTVVELLAPHLRSEDAALRNAVVEALQEMPEDIEPFMELAAQRSGQRCAYFRGHDFGRLASPAGTRMAIPGDPERPPHKRMRRRARLPGRGGKRGDHSAARRSYAPVSK